jgi:hypothetical protein
MAIIMYNILILVIYMNDDKNKELVTVKYEGREFIRIDPSDIDLDKMEAVQKLTKIYAFKVTSGKVKVVCDHVGFAESFSVAETGDYILYNIGEADSDYPLAERLLMCEKKVLSEEKFFKLYSPKGRQVGLDKRTSEIIYKDLQSDNEDNSDFSDFNFIDDLTEHEYSGRAVYAARVPFDFVLKAPWGEDQYIRRGGVIIYNPHTSKEKELDIYGIEGSRNRKPGQFEKTYKLATDKGLIVDTFKMVLKADRSPLPGIQFNNLDLARAYERADKQLQGSLAKYMEMI